MKKKTLLEAQAERHKKAKRAKPFNATSATIKALEAESWTCQIVESRIPHTFITRDCYNFADILACSPTKGIMLVQATGDTSTSNMNKRVVKVKAEPRHAIWLASGGRIQVWSWQKKAGQKERWANVMEIQKETPLTGEVPEFHRITLPCGFGFANVTKDIKPETVEALDKMAQAAMKQFSKPATGEEEAFQKIKDRS